MQITFSTWQTQVLLFLNFLELFMLNIFHPRMGESWDAELMDTDRHPCSSVLVKPQLQGTTEDWLPEWRKRSFEGFWKVELGVGTR